MNGVDLPSLARTLHGWVGLLAAALLLHPVIGAGTELRRGTRWALAGALGATVVTFASGWWLYPDYRADKKYTLLATAPQLASLFEMKEHLGYYALVLTIGGVGLSFTGSRMARRTLICAFVCVMFAELSGAWVGAFTTTR